MKFNNQKVISPETLQVSQEQGSPSPYSGSCHTSVWARLYGSVSLCALWIGVRGFLGSDWHRLWLVPTHASCVLCRAARGVALKHKADMSSLGWNSPMPSMKTSLSGLAWGHFTSCLSVSLHFSHVGLLSVPWLHYAHSPFRVYTFVFSSRTSWLTSSCRFFVLFCFVNFIGWEHLTWDLPS